MQEFVVILIGVVVFGYVIYQIRKTLTRKSSDQTTCGNGCGGSCSSPGASHDKF